VNNTTTGANAACSQSVTVQGTVLETVQSGAVVTAGPGGASGQLVIDAGNPSCSPSTSVLCNATVYDTTTSGTISGSPFVWVAFNTGQGTTITTNSNSAGTLGNFYTGKAGFTVNGCGTPLNALGSPNVTASADAPATGIPAINPSGSDQIDYLVKPRGLAIGQNGAIWNTNNAAADALKTSTYSLTKFTPTYGSAFTPASLISSSAAFTNYTGGGLSATSFTPQFMMIDGSGGPWIAGVSTVAGVAGVVQFDVNGNAISPSNGYIGTTFTSGSTVYSRLVGLGGYGIAIDGNVWVPDSDTGSASPSVLSNTVNVIVGSATPVVTPLALGIKNGTLGMMP